MLASYAVSDVARAEAVGPEGVVRQLQSADHEQSEKDKKMKKLQKALRQIEELKIKRDSGAPLEKTQEGKIEREEELRNELMALLHSEQAGAVAEATGGAE